MNIKHFFSITLLVRRSTAQRMEKRGRFEQWAQYRYLLMLNHTLKSIENQIGGPSPTLIRVDQRYRPFVDRLIRKNPLPPWAIIIDVHSTVYAERLARADKKKWTHVYITRVDSDDLMGEQVRELVLSVPPKFRSMNFNTGFLYDARHRFLSIYHHPSPPFYTDIYSRTELLHKNYPKRKGGHNYPLPGAIKLLPPFNFCVVCHHDLFQDSSIWAQLRKASQKKLHNMPPTLQRSILQELKDFENNLEVFGCPHYKVRAKDKLSIHAGGYLACQGRTPVMTRSRSTLPGVHGKLRSAPGPRTAKRQGRSKKTSIQPATPVRPRSKMPSTRRKKEVAAPIVVRSKQPKMARNTMKPEALAEEHKRLQSPFNSRNNIRRRLRK